MKHTQTIGRYGRIEDRYELENGMVLEHNHYASEWSAKSDKATGKQGGIYVSGAKEPTLFEGLLKYGLRGEDREMDAAWDAHNKMVVEYQRDEFDKVKASPDYLELPESLRAVFDGKLRFSRTAGCSCPCSPGWLGANRKVLGWGGMLYVSNLEHEAEVLRKATEYREKKEAEAAERGFESVQAMQKADAAAWREKAEAEYEAAAAKAREADEERWAAAVG